MKQVYQLVDFIRDYKNAGVFIIAVLLLLIPVKGLGQRFCTNAPTMSLSANSGTTCYLTSITVNDNNFGGSATQVTISSDGHGTILPAKVTSSPFSFTYIPDIKDEGSVVTLSLSTNNPNGHPCTAARATYQLNVTSAPSAPEIIGIIQPTCTSSTGSVELIGLPSYADWTLTASPGGLTVNGSGATATIQNLPTGTYTFSVAVSAECPSPPSGQAQILNQPLIQPAPLPGTITPPTCISATGSVGMSGLPSSGTWTLTRYPGTIQTKGTGTSTVVSDLPAGTFNFSLTSEAGCISLLSTNVIIPAQPPIPSAPVIGTIIQPTMEVSTGGVTLTNLPSTGTWTITRSPDAVTSTGTGTTLTVSELEVGSYTFRVRNSSGCSSPESNAVVISTPAHPKVVITDPPPVCSPARVDLTAPEIKAGSTPGLTYTYWKDSQATEKLDAPTNAPDGTYYIKGTAVSGFFDIKPVIVTVRQRPVSNAGPDQTLGFIFNTIMVATLGDGETGIWSSDSGKVVFSDVTDPQSSVSNLSTGKNVLFWRVSNGVCSADTDKVNINVGNPIIPTLITPNGDSRNEYFIIEGLESLGKTVLTVFDKRGFEIFRNGEYDNKWNGVDYNYKPVPNDTYFFILKSEEGKSYSGYIVVRR